jgi:uncharacterized membrane protein
MSSAIALPLACAILGPFVEAMGNILDKYVISHRVKRPSSFAVVGGVVNLVFGLTLAACLDWDTVSSFGDILFPIIAGIIYGSQYLIYYHMLDEEDVSNVIGMVYVYPILVAILSFLFLGERFPLITYAGIVLALVGAVLLSTHISSLKRRFIVWLMVLLVLLVALHEFFIKVTTNNLPALNGLAVGLIAIGLTLCLGMLHRPTRKGVGTEWRNLQWAVVGEILGLAGLTAIYLAMAGLPATIVSTIGAIQPLILLFLEKGAHAAGLNICSDVRLLNRLVPICLMVLGIVLMGESA